MLFSSSLPGRNALSPAASCDVCKNPGCSFTCANMPFLPIPDVLVLLETLIVCAAQYQVKRLGLEMIC